MFATCCDELVDASGCKPFGKGYSTTADLLLWLCSYVGLKNLGNSCYMNSVLQVLWTLPQMQRRYVEVARNIYETAQDPSSDFATQASTSVAVFCSVSQLPHAFSFHHLPTVHLLVSKTDMLSALLTFGLADVSACRQLRPEHISIYATWF